MGYILVASLLVASTQAVATADDASSLGYPAAWRDVDRHCSNTMVAAWCDTRHYVDLDCVIHTAFDTYGCTCIGNPTLCPTDCLDGVPLTQTASSISCASIPDDDTPNYVLKETHALNRCENNAAVAAWCDDYVNPHLECHLVPTEDQYLCHCSGKHSNCPDECIGGTEPASKTAHIVICSGIPNDSPNYILKDTKKVS